MKVVHQLIAYFHDRTRLSSAEIAHLTREGFNLGEGMDTPIEALDLSPQTTDLLRGAGLYTLGDLLLTAMDRTHICRLLDRGRLDKLRERLFLLGFVDERWLSEFPQLAPHPETDAELLDALAWEQLTQQEHRRRQRIFGPRRGPGVRRRAA